jgi:hypothetical protein
MTLGKAVLSVALLATFLGAAATSPTSSSGADFTIKTETGKGLSPGTDVLSDR